MSPERKERKVVTVVFADLVGFTARAETLDPEDVEAILSPYHARLRGELERFGGTVEKFIGDAVMSVFGAPQAREDDPERAVRAALAIRDWAVEQDGLEVRIAVATGEALVALDARPESGEGMVAGDVVNTAFRLQSAAPVNGVLVGETTFRATERAIDYRPHEPVEAKGKAAPIPVWEVVQARAGFGVDVRQLGRSPLVGRERELDVLLDAQARSTEERTPQLVTVVGVPGIGKSRLVWELFGRADAGEEVVYWHQGRCLPYGDGVTLWALGEIVKAHAGILESDDRGGTAAKLRRAIDALLPDDREARWIEGHLEPLVGLETADRLGADRSDESFAAWRQFFEALADEHPVVLVFEDLHWADDHLLDFVEHLVEWAAGVPLLVVGTTRPELLARRPGWGGGKPNITTLSLPPLEESETALLVHTLLGRAVLSEDREAALFEHSGGNPLYAEEFARLALERRELELPETIQGIIAARLDELSHEEKEALQAAAVVGKVFWLGSVAAITGATTGSLQELLHRLELKEFVRRDRRSSVAGELEYAFRHVLVRDVAHGQLPRPRRAEGHRIAAGWLESLGRPEDHSEMLAHHYLEALELGRVAGTVDEELTSRARAALRDAGERALALNVFPTAVRFLAAALELWPDEESGYPTLLFALGRALHLAADDRSVSVLEDAYERLAGAGDGAAAASAAAVLAEAYHTRGEAEQLDERLERANQLVRDAPASAEKAYVLSEVARFHVLRGDHEAAAGAGSEALSIAEQLGLVELQARALNAVALVRFSRGDDSAVSEMEHAVELARSVNSPEVGRALRNLGAMLWLLGNGRRCHEVNWEAVRNRERLGGMWEQPTRAWRARLHFEEGRWDLALALVDELIGGYDERPEYLASHIVLLRAHLRSARDDRTGALADVARALELIGNHRDPQMVVPDLGDACRRLVELGRVEDACAVAAELEPHLGSAGPRGSALSPIAWVAETVGLHERVQGALAAGRETPWRRAVSAVLRHEWRTAADAYAEIEIVPDEEAAARLRAARAASDAGDHAEADAQLQPALAFYRSVGATRYIREAEQIAGAVRAQPG